MFNQGAGVHAVFEHELNEYESVGGGRRTADLARRRRRRQRPRLAIESVRLNAAMQYAVAPFMPQYASRHTRRPVDLVRYWPRHANALRS